MKQQFLLLLIASSTLLFSCQKETTLADDEAIVSVANSKNNQENSVPFKGDYTTTVTVLQGPPLLRQRIMGTGQATHLGESSFTALSTVTIVPPPPFQVNGTSVFTAANGDEFFTEFTGTSTPIGNGKSSVVITHTITGGTGRFENATGSFVGNTIADPSQPTGSISYIGTINY